MVTFYFRRFALAALVVLLLTSWTMLAQEKSQGSVSSVGASSEAGPAFGDTISFMNLSVTPEDSFLISANYCEVEIVRNRVYEFAIPKETVLKRTDASGVPHYGFRWMNVKEPATLWRFNLGEIDPKSIKSQPVPSPAFLASHDLDEHPWEREQTDLMLVSYSATNSASLIEQGYIHASDNSKQGVPVFDRHSNMGLLVFESKDRAERFVTAFVHAVTICGGKTSDFAPTPSRP